MPDNSNHFGFQSVDPSEKQGRVNAVFHGVADNYDRMNDAMSLGLHRLWKDAMIAALNPSGRSPGHYLDVAGGTGDIGKRIIKKAHPDSVVTVLDINPDMLRVGRDRFAKDGNTDADFICGNAENLPIPSRSQDGYTIAFGIRNVPDIQAALKEAHRVLKPGGRFLCLEFSKVDLPVLDKIYDSYSFNVIPRLGQIIANDSESYQYLIESIRRFPNPAMFEDMIKAAGFVRTSHRLMSGGVVALHSGWKL